MQDYNTIIGVIQMRQNECSFSVIQKRYHIGSGTAQRILSRFEASGLTLEELRKMEPHTVEELFTTRLFFHHRHVSQEVKLMKYESDYYMSCFRTTDKVDVFELYGKNYY